MTKLKTFSGGDLESDYMRVLNEAQALGRVRVRDELGRVFVLRPEGASGLDVPAVDLGFKDAEEIVSMIREERERVEPWEAEMFRNRRRRTSKRVVSKLAKKKRKGAA